MSIHPENSNELNDLMKYVESQELVKVWCKGCGMERDMNKVYAKYVKDMTISECRFCRSE